MNGGWREIGICGLSCRLCPMYQSKSESRCNGCKSKSRIIVGCTFIRCAFKKKGLEFCWNCEESIACEKWKKHREASKHGDSFVCYQKLENNIRFIQEKGIEEFEKDQIIREKLLKEMLKEFNEGRSKTLYCIASTVLQIEELKEALSKSKKLSEGLDIKEKAKILHQVLDNIADEKNYYLKLRK
ncbi:DUF3795 domain-containing protein [[Eubacterium] cellulosolvens]